MENCTQHNMWPLSSGKMTQTAVTHISNSVLNLHHRFPVLPSRTTRVLLHSSSHGPQPVTILPPRLVPLPVAFLPLLPLPFLTPGVHAQQQQPAATSVLSGESSVFAQWLLSFDVSFMRHMTNIKLELTVAQYREAQRLEMESTNLIASYWHHRQWWCPVPSSCQLHHTHTNSLEK